ncbi:MULTISPECIES: hypothetical protein [Flavobacterium]|uniref:Beta-carotene 15,15'-monooxygenase n=1 Tax=Flavobacterium gawalongense TaxID=2594432 RepID=A0A553BHB0_9FLAO|nr:hypothetical protein [Flavobacterium gawalongense]TRX03347.1 hypothetical protein FNW33_03790 [Flavobacterium gawalongense]TRX04050.1 hypothetical protein FNW12_14580 [Flavobacterium gawalongense]TRX07650.1 hypothetical protein FNW11_12455 [Flavobacterium gawalongense]TRX07837.1 hypothetical protein FNW10_13955 [Flavobacterium gawalongense]TRX23570.1 hypothetical protein FNW38_14275 [Flavobacterium gawalongense]
MKELDLLKKDWQKNDNSFEQVSEIEIYKMIHKKSSSIVKWILVISILEVSIWTLISLAFNTDDYFKKLKHDELIQYFEVLTIFNYGVILVFIYLFYKNYILISTTASTKQLMKDILKTRKTVQYYVWYNLGMIVFSLIIGFVIAFSYNPDVSILKDKIANDGKIMAITIGILILTIAVFFGIFWLFYRLLYGILLKRLYANYKELKKIDL